jgi:iron-sulfur cluster assembly protein
MDSISIPFLEEATLDWEIQGLNESFRIINPKETASCGCGVSIGF